MLAFKYPDIEAVEAQVIFTTTSFPVLVTAPPILKAPLMTALPEAVSKALFSDVALIESVAPELTVRLLHTGVLVPLIRGWLTGADGMVTSSEDVGAPEGVQLVAVFHAVLVAPVQVFCAKILDVKAITKADKIIVILFIVVILYD